MNLGSIKMIHIIAIIVVIVIIGVGATQLLGDDAENSKTTISFHIFGDPAEKAAYDSLVAAFEEKHPDIEVEVVYTPGQGDYRRRLASDFAAGTPSDIFFLNYRRYAEWASQDILEPLGPYLNKSDLISEEDFYTSTITPFYWQGTLACIPQNLSSLVVYYNKDLFDQYGVAYPANDWTWDDFLATALALTDAENDIWGVGIDASIFRIAPFIWQNGGDLVDHPVYPTKLTLDTPAAREAIAWVINLRAEHHVVPDRVAEEAMQSEDRFLNGTMAMYFNSRRGVPTYRSIDTFEWDAVPLPVAPNGTWFSILHSDAYCMYKGADNKDAVWTFIEFANSHEGQTLIAASGRTVPSLKSVAESPAFLDGLPPANAEAAYLANINRIRGVPIIATWVEIETIFSDELERAFYDGADIDEVIAAGIENTLFAFTEEE